MVAFITNRGMLWKITTVVVVLCLIALVKFASTYLVEAFVLNDGRSCPAVVHVYMPRNASVEEATAANELARVLEIATNNVVLVSRESWFIPFQGEGYYVGKTAQAQMRLPELVTNTKLVPRQTPLAPFDPSSSSLFLPLEAERWDNVGWCESDGRIVIAASDHVATRIAVSRFLHENFGVRWWMPGDVGCDIPPAESPYPQSLPKAIIKPSYCSRLMTSISPRKADYGEWSIHNGLRGHIPNGHALDRILGPEDARQHPDWFPTFEGRPVSPLWMERRQEPHPLYTSKGMAAFIASKAVLYFNNNPDIPAFSISPSDNSLMGDPGTYAGLVDENAECRGYVDYSNAVFTYANNVASIISKSHPDRLLGILAYSFYQNVPDFSLEPNLVPFLTTDRSQWYDKSYRAEDLALIGKWSRSGARLIGTRDYYYGFPYLVPRTMTDHVMDSIPTLYKAGVRAFHSELDPIWGYDAPKAWLAAQLLWDANADPVQLRDEFYEGCYGPAADAMGRFFSECDQAWNAQSGPARWIKYFGNLNQASLYTPDRLRRMRELLDQATSMPLTDKQRARVQMTYDAFVVTETFCASQPVLMNVVAWTTDQSVDELLRNIPDYLAAKTVLRFLPDMHEAVASGMFMRSLGFITEEDPLAGRLVLARPFMTKQQIATVLEIAPQYEDCLSMRAIWLGINSFRDGLTNWTVSSFPEAHQVVSSNEPGSVTFNGANSCSIHMTYKVSPGRLYACAFRVRGSISSGATCRLLIEYYDNNGARIGYCADRLNPGVNENTLLSVAATAPEGASRLRLMVFVTSMEKNDEIRLSALQNTR